MEEDNLDEHLELFRCVRANQDAEFIQRCQDLENLRGEPCHCKNQALNHTHESCPDGHFQLCKKLQEDEKKRSECGRIVENAGPKARLYARLLRADEVARSIVHIEHGAESKGGTAPFLFEDVECLQRVVMQKMQVRDLLPPDLDLDEFLEASQYLWNHQLTGAIGYLWCVGHDGKNSVYFSGDDLEHAILTDMKHPILQREKR